MTRFPDPCPFAVADPDTFGKHNQCTSWSADCDERGCARKRYFAQRRKAELAQYRRFPGNDLQQARKARHAAIVAAGGTQEELRANWLKAGHCSWCEGEIYDPKKSSLNLRRGWHDGRNGEPNCLGLYFAHTRTPDQLEWIIDRDGTTCAGCGTDTGHWSSSGFSMSPERAEKWGPAWTRSYPPETYWGEWTGVSLSAALEVDHKLALKLVVLTIPPEEQWRYWGPMNLQGLCNECHRIKTREDVRLIKSAQREIET